MADFCRQCSRDVDPNFPGDDLAGLCRAGETASVLCEGCGTTQVDSKGYCMGLCSDPRHVGPEWWTAHEVANLFRVHPNTVYVWIQIGKLPAARIRRNVYRIRREDVMKLAGEKEPYGGLKMDVVAEDEASDAS